MAHHRTKMALIYMLPGAKREYLRHIFNPVSDKNSFSQNVL